MPPDFLYPRPKTPASRGKHNRLRLPPAGFTALALDGYGLRGHLPPRPAKTASYPVSVRQVTALLHASCRPRLPTTPWRAAPPFTSMRLGRGLSPPSCGAYSTPQTKGATRRLAPAFGWAVPTPHFSYGIGGKGLGEFFVSVRALTKNPFAPSPNHHPSNLSSNTFMAQKRPHMVHWSSLAWESSR